MLNAFLKKAHEIFAISDCEHVDARDWIATAKAMLIIAQRGGFFPGEGSGSA